MKSQNRIPWLRIAAESIAIIGSILLAFAIDAWWAGVANRQDEIESLELISRDLLDTKEQLREYSNYAELASRSALNVYVALSDEGPYDHEYIRNEMLRVDRMTVRVPRAAYKELLSTGNLRVIRSRELRDALVRFYESVERSELVIQKNNEAFLDGLLTDIYYAEGLLLPHFSTDSGLQVVNSAVQSIKEQLPTGFVHQDDPLWGYDPDSVEWRRLRSTMLYAAQIHNVGIIQGGQTIAAADRLSALIDDALAR